MKISDSDLIRLWKREEKRLFKGWDFSYLKGRVIDEKPPWDYTKMAKRLVKKSRSVLDMGTGGGEIFSKLAPFPDHAVATEGYRPNIAIARKCLAPLSVHVVDFENSSVKKMPFKDNEFDLILNRHDVFYPKEVFRILNKGGIFLTQQVGRENLNDLAKAFGKKAGYKIEPLPEIRKSLEKAGFKIMTCKEFKGKTIFKDIGALVYFLKAVPWCVPGFSIGKNKKQLLGLQRKLDSGKRLRFAQVRYLILAEKA